MSVLAEAYKDFFPFNPKDIHLVEALRMLRMLHHHAWLAKRWNDPAFQQAFPWFADDCHWEWVIEQLRKQLDETHQPDIVLGYHPVVSSLHSGHTRNDGVGARQLLGHKNTVASALNEHNRKAQKVCKQENAQ